MTLNCILTLVFAVTVCISLSAFASLVDISKGIMSSTIELNICTIIARIKKYKSIIKKKKEKHYKIALLAKTNLDSIKVLISWSLNDWYTGPNYFPLTNILRKYDDMKEDTNEIETS